MLNPVAGQFDAIDDFVDVRIVDLDLPRTTWSRVHDSLRVMYLRLDREPPDNEWVRLFFEERRSRIVALRRGLWIEEGWISFDAAPREVETVHLPDIRRSVDYANRTYREVVARRRMERDRAQQTQRDERDDLLALQERVRNSLVQSSPTKPPLVEEPAATDSSEPFFKSSSMDPPADASADAIDLTLDARRAELRDFYRSAIDRAGS